MGFGLVDPILPVISSQLGASQSQVTLLFTGYNLVMAVTMLFTGKIASTLGIKKTLISGVIIIALFSSFSGMIPNVESIILLRCVWGFGNALFIATALTAIMNYSTGDADKPIMLFETAVGIGFSAGPLLGGILGQLKWSYPFFGVGTMMAISFILLLVLLPSSKKDKSLKNNVSPKNISIFDPINAIAKSKHIRTFGIVAFLYNFGFFTLFAYAPFVLGLDAIGIGLVFLVWGILVALTSVIIAPKIKDKIGSVKSIYGILSLFLILFIILGIWTNTQWLTILCVILSGAVIGTSNTLLTTAVMEGSPIDRPTTSAAYNFLRFIGSAIAPFLAGIIGESISPHAPFFVGGAVVLCGIIFMYLNRNKIFTETSKEDYKIQEYSEKVEDFMIKDVVSIKSNAKVRELLELINNNNIGGVPVVDDNNKLKVVISDGDIIRYLTPKENVHDFIYDIYIEEESTQEVLDKKINKTIEDLIINQNLNKKEIFTIRKEESFEKAMKILSKHHFKKLPVVNSEGKIEGIISRGDINSTLFNIIAKIHISEDN